MSDCYDAIIIGSGQGGGPLSTALVGDGKRTALIERAEIGGTCINTGCTPTKTMIGSATVAHAARVGAKFGVQTGDIRIDTERVRARKRDMVRTFRQGSEEAILKGGAEIIRGSARFTGPRALTVDLNGGATRDLTADVIVIDTGTRPVIPHIPGLDSVPFLDSTSIMEMATIPEHLLVLGGGYIGLEFAQMFHRFGSRVTVIQREAQLLPNQDDDVATAVADLLREEGIDVLVSTTANSVERQGERTMVSAQDGSGERTIEGSHLLVAVGRRPNTEDLDLSKAGIDTDEHGFVKVDEYLKTSVEDVYAIGDCAGTPPFTHMSYDDFRILKANLIEGKPVSKQGRLVPYVLFIDPQLGCVGLTEKEAKASQVPYKVARMGMSHVARALESGNSRGVMKVLVSPEDERILGCAILGMEGGELMAMIEIAMMTDMPYTRLRDGIFAHPTLAESFNNLFGSL